MKRSPKIAALLVATLIFVSHSPVEGWKWKLVWSDEFEELGLLNAQKWSYEEGFVRNHEKQLYTAKRLKNARVEKGNLVIEAHLEQFANPSYEAGSADWRLHQKHAAYTSASLQTKGLATWRYGRTEVRAKVPRGAGTWPAIWTLGANIDTVGWPRCGESDVMEFLGKEENFIHATAHFWNGSRHDSDSKKHPVSEPWKDFRVYAIEWTENQIHFEYDGQRYQTFQIKKADGAEGNPLRRPHYLILNLAPGGRWGGEIDDSIFPCRYLIDYVRVFRHADEPQESTD